jgi:hypothetical protein
MTKINTKKMTRILLFVLLLFSLFSKFEQVYAAKITAEKNCVVRIDSDMFAQGETVHAVKGTETKKQKKSAVILIHKVGAKKSVGKVIKGPKNCSSLVGLSVVKLDSTQPSDISTEPNLEKSSSKKITPHKLQISIGMGGQIFSSQGAHQQSANNVPSINLIAFQGKMSIFPLQFSQTSSFASKLFGVGVSYDHGVTIPSVSVAEDPSAVQNPEQTAPATPASGKQSTTTVDFFGGLILRAVYLGQKINTQLLLGYQSHSLVHKLTSSEGLGRSPLRNFAVNGMSIGLRQEFRFTPMLILGVEGKTILGSKGKIDITSDKTTDRSLISVDIPKKSSAIQFSADVSTLFKLFQVGGGFQYHSYDANFVTLEGTEAAYKENQMKFLFLMGIML